MNNYTPSLGSILKQYRAVHNLQQKDLAVLINVSKAQLSKIESGIHSPKFELSYRILRLLIPDLDSAIAAHEFKIKSE